MGNVVCGELPRTGAPLVPLGIAGLVLLALGAVAVRAGREQ